MTHPTIPTPPSCDRTGHSAQETWTVRGLKSAVFHVEIQLNKQRDHMNRMGGLGYSN